MSNFHKQTAEAWMYESRKCPICGKEFYPSGRWAYKKLGKYFCSWSCLRKWEKANEEKTKMENKKYHYKKVEQLTLEGELVRIFDNVDDAVAEIDGTSYGIRNACRTSGVYKGYLWRYCEEEKADDQA